MLQGRKMTMTESTLPTVGAAFLAAFGLIAQATSGIPDFERIGGNLVGLGFVAWYAWYTTAKVIPGLVADFRQELVKEREHSASLLAIERADNKEQMIALEQRLERVVTVVERLVEGLRANGIVGGPKKLEQAGQ